MAESTSPSYIERAPERKQKQEPEQKQIHPLTPASQGPCVSNKEPDHASTTKSTAAVEVESRPVQGFEENRGLALALAGPGMPNSARGSGSHASHVDRFDPFVDQVMQGCGFTSRRLRPVLEAVVQLQADLGEHPATTALAMKAAWRKYVLQDTALRFKWGARKFFGEGYWKNETSWPWDNEVLKDKRNAMQAGVGSWR